MDLLEFFFSNKLFIHNIEGEKAAAYSHVAVVMPVYGTPVSFAFLLSETGNKLICKKGEAKGLWRLGGER